MEQSSSCTGTFSTHQAKWGGNGKLRQTSTPWRISSPAPSPSPQQDAPRHRIFGGKRQLIPSPAKPGSNSISCLSHLPASSPLFGLSHRFSGPPFPLTPSLLLPPLCLCGPGVTGYIIIFLRGIGCCKSPQRERD